MLPNPNHKYLIALTWIIIVIDFYVDRKIEYDKSSLYFIPLTYYVGR